MLRRERYLQKVKTALKRSRVVALIGPRQCGKSTLARELVAHSSPNYFDLEDPVSLRRLEQPMLSLAPLRGLVVLDEIQLQPALFPILRVLADRKPLPARFLVLGSAAPSIRREGAESLAGRIETIELTPFALREIPQIQRARHWLRGGFPEAFLARSHTDAFAWLNSFTRTFIQRDVVQMGFGATPALLDRFWRMLAHCHGQTWNAAEPARSLGVNESTVRRYLDILSELFMIRQLQPWHANLLKRQVKSPKVYFRDTGVYHMLLGIRSQQALQTHIRLGASFEGYVIEELLRSRVYDEAYFWATHAGAELDLLLLHRGKRIGYEIKYADAPEFTNSMHVALRDLGLDSLCVCYPGTRRYKLASEVTVVPFEEVVAGGA